MYCHLIAYSIFEKISDLKSALNTSKSITKKQHIQWFAAVAVIKLLLFVFFAYQFSQNYPADITTARFFIIDGETTSYYAPIESMAKGKGYSFEEEVPGKDTFIYFPSTRRVPGIVPIYYPLLKMFGIQWGRICLIIVQFMLSTVSVYLLGLIAYMIFQSYITYVIVLILYSFSSFVSIFDHYGISESLSISFMIFGVYFSLKAVKEQHMLFYFLAGFFLCWSTFIRPAFGVIFPSMATIFIWQFIDEKKLLSIKSIFSLAVFSATLLLSLSLWTHRNYKVSGKIIPLEDNVYESQAFAYDAKLISIWELIGAWGGQITRWSPNSMGEYFLSKKDIDSQTAFSERMLCSQVSFDSIKSLQQNYLLACNLNLSAAQRESYNQRVIEQASRFKKCFQKEKPFQYYVVSPIAMTGKFLYFTTVSYLPFPKLSNMQLYHKAIKFAYILYFNIILIFAALGSILMVKNKHRKGLLMLIFPLLYTFVMIYIFSASEQRYVAPLYPFFVLFAGYFFSKYLPTYWLHKIQGAKNID